MIWVQIITDAYITHISCNSSTRVVDNKGMIRRVCIK